MASSGGDLELEIERTMPASRPVVFAAFTEPGELVSWWGPEGFTVPTLDFEPRPGASYRIQMRPPEGEAFHLTGEFRDVDPLGRLAFTFAWEPPDPDDVTTTADLSFSDLGSSTEVVLWQGPFKTEERRGLHQAGWSESFDKLERLLLAR